MEGASRGRRCPAARLSRGPALRIGRAAGWSGGFITMTSASKWLLSRLGGTGSPQLAALLPIRERLLGPEHPAAHTTRGNLASWSRSSGPGDPRALQPGETYPF